jgi:hypothetical protein
MGLRFGTGSVEGPAHRAAVRVRREREQDRCADAPPEEGEANKKCGGFALWGVLRASSLRLCLLTS